MVPILKSGHIQQIYTTLMNLGDEKSGRWRKERSGPSDSEERVGREGQGLKFMGLARLLRLIVTDLPLNPPSSRQRQALCPSSGDQLYFVRTSAVVRKMRDWQVLSALNLAGRLDGEATSNREPKTGLGNPQNVAWLMPNNWIKQMN